MVKIVKEILVNVQIINFSFPLITFDLSNKVTNNLERFNITYFTRKNIFCNISEQLRCCPTFETFEKKHFFVFGRFYDEFNNRLCKHL